MNNSEREQNRAAFRMFRETATLYLCASASITLIAISF